MKIIHKESLTSYLMQRTIFDKKHYERKEDCNSNLDVNLFFLKEYNAENNLGVTSYKLMEMARNFTLWEHNFVYSLEDGYEEFREKVIGLDYDEILEMYIENLVHPFEMPHWQKKKNYLYFKDKILPQIKYIARLR